LFAVGSCGLADMGKEQMMKRKQPAILELVETISNIKACQMSNLIRAKFSVLGWVCHVSSCEMVK
jgi:hypothetical protein